MLLIGDGSGSLFGSNKGRLSSYSIIVMVVWIFNAFGHEIHSPVQALLHFLQYYSEFDWYRHALTVHGAVTIEDLSPLSDDSGQPSGRFIPDSVLLGCRLRYAELGKKKIPVDLGGVENKAGSTASEALMLGDTNSVYMRGILNVIDPIKEKRNITRSVDSAGFNAIRTGFRQGYLAFLEMAKMCREVPITDATLPESMSSKVPAAPISSPTAIRNADVPFVRSFLVNTTSVLKNAGRGRIIGSHNLADPFKSSNDEIEVYTLYY